MSFLDRVMDVKSSVNAKLEDVGGLKDKGYDKIQETLAQFNDYAPIIMEAGFDVSGLSVVLGLPPKVVASFSYVKVISDEEAQLLLETHKEKAILSKILQTLFKINELKGGTKVGKLAFDHVEIELGLIPSVTLIFS